MNDYAQHLIAARAALALAEQAANQRDWVAMGLAAHNAQQHSFAIASWAREQQLEEL